MNIFVGIMIALAAIGFIDKLIGGRMGLADHFDEGLSTMGTMMIPIMGTYCIGVTIVQHNIDAIAELATSLPFDPSIIVGSVLAADYGALPISLEMAATREIGILAGLMVSSTLGATVCFRIPVFMSSVRKEDIAIMMRGLVIGLIALPVTIISGGLLLGMPLNDLALNASPVVGVCLVLVIGVRYADVVVTRVLVIIGNTTRIFCLVFFALVVFDIYLSSWDFVSADLLLEAFVVLLKTMVVICGSMVLMHFILSYWRKPIVWISQKMKISEKSVLGMIISLVNFLPMLVFYKDMDERGKLVAGAFSVSGAYVFGGQLALAASMVDGYTVTCFIIAKLTGAAAAVALAVWLSRSSQVKCPKTKTD